MEDVEYEVVEPDELPTGDDLDAGERAAMSVARDRNAVHLTDDLDAREAASATGIDVHGSIGVIALGYSRGWLDLESASSRMRALQQETTLFVTDAVVGRGIKILEES